ncbi:MAG TPA: hypothetical protein VHV27_01265 [Phenylobacterium sp.]|jgi:hypothetical protein|nr:hypothetical protein [Phenylobacterium sp.]
MEWRSDQLRTALSGAVIAAVAGLLLGAAAKPDLAADDRPAGPQMLSPVGGERSAGPFADDVGVGFASYRGKLPDYVIGTDTTKAMSIYPSADAPPPMKVAIEDDPPPPELPATPVADDDPAPPAPSYPSIDGGRTASDPIPGPAVG